MRIYASSDVIGVEVGGAVKNVMAIAAGISDGMGLGYNARAALLTRGLAEMTRLGLKLGGRPETLGGLSGVGDLILTCTGDLSRNRQVGLLLAQQHDSAGDICAGLAMLQKVFTQCAKCISLRNAWALKCLSVKRFIAYSMNTLLPRIWSPNC